MVVLILQGVQKGWVCGDASESSWIWMVDGGATIFLLVFNITSSALEVGDGYACSCPKIMNTF